MEQRVGSKAFLSESLVRTLVLKSAPKGLNYPPAPPPSPTTLGGHVPDCLPAHVSERHYSSLIYNSSYSRSHPLQLPHGQTEEPAGNSN